MTDPTIRPLGEYEPPATVTGSDVVQRAFPYDGPHSAETVRSAAEAASALVRYLNNATRDMATLEEPANLANTVSYVGAAVGRLDQLFRQLSQAAGRFAEDGRTYDDRRDRDGADTARDLATELAAVTHAANELHGQIQRAAELAAHLGHDETGEDPE